MKPVIKGEKITAQKFNEVIDAINNAVGAYSQNKVDPLMPDGFVIVGNITSELDGNCNQTFTLSSVQLLNTWQPNGELIGDRTITENLDQLTSFYLVKEMPSERHPEPTSDASVLTNVEAGSLDPYLEWDKRLLYEVSCNVSTGTFEIIRDYRIANGICSSGGTGDGGDGGACSCDISAYYTEYDSQGNRNNKIATWTNGKEGDAAKTVDIYAPAGGGGSVTLSGWSGEFYTGYGLKLDASANQLQLTADTKLTVANGLITQSESGSFTISRLDLTRHSSL